MKIQQKMRQEIYEGGNKYIRLIKNWNEKKTPPEYQRKFAFRPKIDNYGATLWWESYYIHYVYYRQPVLYRDNAWLQDDLYGEILEYISEQEYVIRKLAGKIE